MGIDRKVLEKYPDIMSTQEVAKLIGVHPATVTIIARDPAAGLKSFRVTNKKKSPLRFFKSSVICYLEARAFSPIANSL
jgi:hypothetical protein